MPKLNLHLNYNGNAEEVDRFLECSEINMASNV